MVFAAALPWLELRDVARALALRFPSIDTSPMSSLGGQISLPGSHPIGKPPPCGRPMPSAGRLTVAGPSVQSCSDLRPPGQGR